MPILHSPESRLKHSIFEGIEHLPPHEVIKTVLYRFGMELLGRPIEIPPVKVSAEKPSERDISETNQQ